MTIAFSSSSLQIAKWSIFSGKFEVLSSYMKLCVNLNLGAEKKNYCLKSLNYVITIVFFVSCIKQKNYFFRITLIYFAFTICFHKDLYLMTVKLPNLRNNLLEEMNPKWDCIVSKNMCFPQIFMATEKKSNEIFRL